jgi:hypothetical protein
MASNAWEQSQIDSDVILLTEHLQIANPADGSNSREGPIFGMHRAKTAFLSVFHTAIFLRPESIGSVMEKWLKLCKLGCRVGGDDVRFFSFPGWGGKLPSQRVPEPLSPRRAPP